MHWTAYLIKKGPNSHKQSNQDCIADILKFNKGSESQSNVKSKALKHSHSVVSYKSPLSTNTRKLVSYSKELEHRWCLFNLTSEQNYHIEVKTLIAFNFQSSSSHISHEYTSIALKNFTSNWPIDRDNWQTSLNFPIIVPKHRP